MSKIAVCVVTYNQEKYIAQCLDSALMQVCTQTVVIYVGEDYSSDSTGLICDEYARKYSNIKVFHSKSNIGLVRNTIQILEAIKADGCSYIAMLDGDDYWIDREKLQKEYDFLERNQDYGLVHTNMYLLYNDKLIATRKKGDVVPSGNVFDIFSSYTIGNCTAFYKTDLLKYINLDDLVSHGFMSLDYVMYCIFAKNTKIGYLSDLTSVWRRGHASVSNANDMHKQIAYLENDIRMWRYLDEKYDGYFYYSEDSVVAYKDSRTFQIAYKYMIIRNMSH